MDRNEASKFCNPEWTEKSYYLCAFRRIVIRRPVQQSKTIPFRMPWQLNHGVVERIWIQSSRSAASNVKAVSVLMASIASYKTTYMRTMICIIDVTSSSSVFENSLSRWRSSLVSCCSCFSSSTSSFAGSSTSGKRMTSSIYNQRRRLVQINKSGSCDEDQNERSRFGEQFTSSHIVS